MEIKIYWGFERVLLIQVSVINFRAVVSESEVPAFAIGPDFKRGWHTVRTRGLSKTAKSAAFGELSAD